MEFLKLLIRKSKMFFLSVFLLGVVNSVLNGALLMFINNTITQRPLPFFQEYAGLIFLGIIISSLLVSQKFQVYMIRLTNDILYEFEMSILEKLRYASFSDFEKLGKEKVFSAINDARTLGNVPQLFVNTFNSFIMVCCCMAYMFWISPIGGVLVMAIMGTLLVYYLARNKKASKDLNELRDLQNHFYKYLRDLMQGFKEVKMSTSRNDNIFTRFFLTNRSRGRVLSTTTSIRYMNNELTGSYSWYIVLGVAMFVLPKYFNLGITQVSAFIVTILYLIGPTANLITFIPVLTRVKIALNRLDEYETLLDSSNKEKIGHGDLTEINKKFSSIEFRKVVFEYHDQVNNKTFTVGPLDLKIRRGEKIFITGGNGSGKTTFVKLLTGLYQPTAGQILLNGHVITENNLPYYRDQISAIFTNNHIFSENYDGFDIGKNNENLQAYIEMVRLSGIIRVNEQNYEINEDLSAGQRKRLALVLSLMESREIMVLDEWAAEQDPQFRSYFYKKLVSYLQQQGKTVIAITHDDAYYHLADRLIKFDFGRIIEDRICLPVIENELNIHSQALYE